MEKMKKTEEIKTNYLEGERLSNFKSLSGIEYKEVYDENDWHDKLPTPGQYPFTRGIHETMYRGRLWTRRQQSGFGTPEESNELFKYLIKVGQTGLNMDADIGTKLGLDPDYPLAQGDVGLQGTSLCTYEDMRALYQDIALDEVSSTLIIQPPYSAIVMAWYLQLAKEGGIPWENLIGTIMNCAFTQLVGPTFQANTTFFPIDLAVKIGVDIIEYMIPQSPKWNVINVNSRNIRETGVDAIQEAAFVLCLASDYIKEILKRGLDIDSFAHRIGFFSSVESDFFEEVAKFRAMRRIWARLLKETFNAKNDRSLLFRVAVQTSAITLTAQEPLNNIVRSSIQTLAAVLAGTQSIHTTSYDEALALPTKESQKVAIRAQQVIAYETGVAKTVDPLGGSYFLESLTDELEARILDLMDEIENQGGFIQCFKKGWIEQQINQARDKWAKTIETGERPIVGVNLFEAEEESEKINIFRQRLNMQAGRIQYVRDYKKSRDQAKAHCVLESLENFIKKNPQQNIFEQILNAATERVTLQEISDALRRGADFSIPS